MLTGVRNLRSGSGARVIRAGWFFCVFCGLLHATVEAAPKAKRKKQSDAPTATASDPTASSEAPANHPLAPALDLARESRAALKAVRDYTATFIKRELVGRRMIEQSMNMKCRAQPFSVYFDYQGAEQGREVLFVEGEYRGKLLVHDPKGLSALAGTVQLAPNSPEAMRENRYPISKVGIANLIETIAAQWESETQFAEIEVKLYPNAKLGDVACQAIQSSHPQPRQQFRFHMTRLYLDKVTNLPVRVEQFDWPKAPGGPPVLVEEYTYRDLRLNVGLTDEDFSPQNRKYRF